MKLYIAGIGFFFAGIFACKKEITEAFSGFTQPSNFPTPVYKFSNNPITKEGFELGRKLFYDPILSADNTISCGSCHIQSSAFTQHGHSVSHGIFDRLGTRNSPAIMNLAWMPEYMWDGGIADLDLQPIAPITNPVEMNDSMHLVLQKLRNHSQYPALFEKAFGSSEITTARFLKALSQFMLMCVSNNSRYDSVMRKQTTFNNDETAGYNLFVTKCASCHKEPLFTDFSYRNNGLSISRINDEGRKLVTLQTTDTYKFKVPTLRNWLYTAPYMHDGRFLNIDAVLEHYNSGVEATLNLDPLLQNNHQLGIPLSATEKAQLLSFLKTLNDKTFVTNPLLAEH